MEFASIAKTNLECIRSEDPKKLEALDYVVQWIEKNRHFDYSDHKIFLQKSFESLGRGYKRLLDGTVKFAMACRDKKRLWKKYLPELHDLTGRAHSWTEIWLKGLQEEKANNEKAFEQRMEIDDKNLY